MRFPAILIFLAAAMSASAGVVWVEDPELIIPSSADKPLLLFFHRSDDVEARLMETWTFSDPLVERVLEQVQPVSINLDEGPNFGDHFLVAETPTLLLITPDQHEVARHRGELTADQFLGWLRSALAHVQPDPEEEEAREEEAAPPPATTEEPFLTSEPEMSTQPPGRTSPLESLVPRHRPPLVGQSGQAIPIQVHVPSGADRVMLHHRRPGARAFYDVMMNLTTPELFYAVIPPEDVTPAGVEYYITISLRDQSITLPPQGPGRPHLIGVH